MTKKLQFKRYANNVIANTIGADGELIINTNGHVLTVHDGVHPGGIRHATEAFVLSHSGYTDANVAAFLPTYDGIINTNTLFSNTFVNISALGGAQFQYDPTGVYNYYEIANGSWFYINGEGLVFQSNTTGTWSTTTLTNDGGISFSDSTIQYTAWTGADSWSRQQANLAFNKANSSFNQANFAFTQANNSYTLANNALTIGQLAFNYSNSNFNFANSAALYANGAFIEANAAFNVANSATILAQAAYDAANADLTLISNQLTSNVEFINAINSNQNTAIGSVYTQANSAFNAANNKVLKTGDSMTGSLSISNTTSSISNVTGALVVNGGMGLTGNVFFSGGRVAMGDSLNHPNIANVFNINSSSGTTAFRALTMIDTSANLKIVRLGSSDPGIELMKWDSNLTQANAYFDIIAGFSTNPNTLSIRDRNQGNPYRFHITANGYIALGGGSTVPLANANLHVFGNAIFTTGITTSNVIANVVNSGVYLTNTGADVYLTSTSAFTQANAAFTQANNSLNIQSGGTITGDITANNITSNNSLTVIGQTSLGGAAGSESFRAVPVTSSVNYVTALGSTGTNPSIRVEGSDPNINLALSSKGASTSASNIRFYTNNLAQEQMRVSHTASAVNYVNVTGASAGNNPVISAQGSDASIGITFVTKGSYGMQFNNASGGTIVQYTQNGTVSATTNFLRFTNFNGTGGTPVISTQGSDTNIDLTLTAKGTGQVNHTSRIGVTYQPATTVNTAIEIAAANTIGGTGYADFLKFTNTSGGATNPNKTIRLNSTGALEIINSAYTSSLLLIQDNGDTVFGGNTTTNGIAAGYAPNRPAFRVTGGNTTTGLTTTQNGTGQLNYNNWTLDYNQGSYLNYTGGTFTAPVAGLYQICLNARNAGNAGTSQIICYKNGSTVMTMIEFAGSSTMNHTGGSTIAKLAAGDTLTIKVALGTITFDGNDSWSVAYLG